LIAFCFSAHIFPVMPRHTIDSLFFGSLGMMLVQKKSEIGRLAGYALAEMTPLFRQNFAFHVPGTLIVMGAWRRKLAWVFACLPTASYLAFLAMNGALGDAIVQLTSYGFLDVVRRGFAVYVLNAGLPLGLLLGYYGASLQRTETSSLADPRLRARAIGKFIFILIPTIAILSLAFGGMHFTREPSYALFGAVAGVTLFSVSGKGQATTHLRSEILAILLACTASLSTGYNTPALASGPLVLFLVARPAKTFGLPGWKAPPLPAFRVDGTRFPPAPSLCCDRACW